MDLLSAFRRNRPPSVKSPSRWRPGVELLERRDLMATTITINATAGVHAIDPNIYGLAHASTAQLNDLNIPINRNGGNASDTYSYQQDATNRGSDWYFESIASGSGNGQGMDAWIDATRAGGAQADVTVNIFDWAAKVGAGRSKLASYSIAKYGQQTGNDWQWMPDAGNGIRSSDGQHITWNTETDAYVASTPAFQQVWIDHLISRYGLAADGGVKYYTLGNEPGLWHETHRDIHDIGATHIELRDRMVAYATMIKSRDPGALIIGPEEWGWTNYFISGRDSQLSNWGATYNGLPMMPWLLDQLRQASQTAGKRLLDYFTLHYYPQGGEALNNDVSTAMQLLRNQSTRSLWDPNYVDQSWIGQAGPDQGKVNLINRMEGWVNTYYPGTKIGVTEYNWGAEDHMNGATTQADILGIFGREGLDLANFWATPATNSEAYLAFKMYRNYDGADGMFGDTSVQAASTNNADNVSVFASKRSSDGALTIMVVNKQLSTSEAITVNLAGFTGTGVAQRWQLAAVGGDPNNGSITHPGNVSYAGSSFSATVPNQSVTIFVLAASAGSAPSITTQPANQTVNAGQTATFSVVATGTGTLTYQWQRSNDGGATWNNVGGATGTSCTTPATVAGDHNARFRVNVSNANGTTTSNSAILTVNFAPSITTQPSNQTRNAGQTATFSVVAAGNPAPTYQWQRSNDGGATWNPVGGATSASYTTAATTATDNGARFRVVVTNSVGNVTSSTAILTVNYAPSITTQPANRTVNPGQTATFTAAAGGNPAPTYQWQRLISGTWTNISGATSASYTTAATTAADNGAQFRVVATNSVSSATSDAALLTVNQPPAIISPPINRTVTVGQTATFSVTATGTGPLSYQWQRSNNGGTTWSPISGATGSSYITPPTVLGDNNARFRVVVTNVAGSTTSASATLTVKKGRHARGAAAPAVTRSIPRAMRSW